MVERIQDAGVLNKLDVDLLGVDKLNVPAMVLDLSLKAGILEDLLRTNRLEQRRVPEIGYLAQHAFLSTFIGPNYSVEGIDNIRNAKEEAIKTDKRLIYSLRHDGDVDHLIWRYVFDHEGLKDEADRTVFVAGVNMLKRPGIRIFMRAEHVIYIATPADVIRSRVLFREGDRIGLDNEDRELMEWAHGIFSATNQAADPKFEAAIKRGETVAVYGEAGRPYDGLMKQISRYIAEAYFPKDDSALIVSMRMYGGGEFNPPNQTFRFWKALPGLKQHIGLKAIPAYPSNEVWDWRKSQSQNPGDMIAAYLAAVDSEQIRVSDLLRYQRIMDRRHPGSSNIRLPEGLEDLWPI